QAATEVGFVDPFPEGLVLASDPVAGDGCGDPTITGAAGDMTLELAGAEIAPQGECLITVDVLVEASDDVTNTTDDLTSSLGTVPGVSATLQVTEAAPLSMIKAFDAEQVFEFDTVGLSFTITNPNPESIATDVSFTDPFPAGLEIVTAPVADEGCGAPTLTGEVGGTVVTFDNGEIAGGGTCVVSLTVQVIDGSDLTNVVDDLASSLAISQEPDEVKADLSVIPTPPPLFSKAFAPEKIKQFDVSTLTLTIDNSQSPVAATNAGFTDTLPDGLTIAAATNARTTCADATLGLQGGGSAITLSGATVPASGQCLVSVDVTSPTPGTYRNTSGDLTSSLGNSGTASATLTVEEITTGTVTIIQLAEPDGVFEFTSEAANLNFAITTSGGEGSSGPITVERGSYVIKQRPPEGFGSTAINCNDDDSTGNPRTRTISVNVDAQEAVICTVTSINSRQKTVDTINRFLTRRADLILASEPRLGRRLDRLNRGFGNSSTLTFSNGDLGAMLPFSFDPMSIGSGNYKFSTSLLQARQAAASLALAHGAYQDKMYVENSRWDVWFEAQYKRFDDGGSGDGHFGIGYLGADYLLSQDVLIGMILQFDTMEDESNGATTRGTGWMFGPYMTARLAPNLYFDGRIAAGQSTNKISPFNTYTDEFETSRWLIMANLTGEFQRGPWTIRPNASLSYFEETQRAYRDSLGVSIPSQTVKLGQFKFGPTFSGRFETENGSIFEPHFSLDAIYNMGDTEGVTLTNQSTPATDGWRGRIEMGLNFTTEYGSRISIGGTYDGIGRDDYETYGVKIDVTIPIKKNNVQ
ncbi:MAG: autotransporter domain-containing protein, partial [Paracoccaceae bacterium]|nr:autotransporter domain-containing protein [Paracoccaceae bacterium]